VRFLGEFCDLEEVVRGELAENAIRKDFLPSEIEAIRRAIEPLEKAAAKERQVSTLKRGDPRDGVTSLRVAASVVSISPATLAGATVAQMRNLL
jgi:hypothetical protein